AAVAGASHRVDIGLRGIQRDIHVGELCLHELEAADRLAELRALVNVGHDEIETGLHQAKRSRSQHGTLVIEARHQHIDAVADDAEYVLGRHFAVGEYDLAGIGAAHPKLV